LNRNLQPGIHPDADQFSVFVEGAATAREQEKMLAHLAACAECRKAVFLMQPHEEPQRVTATPERGWMWRWLVPVGLPAAALACGLIAVLVYIRPHGASETPQPVAIVRPPETEQPGTTAAPSSNLRQGAPTANADRAASINSEQVARSGGRQNGLAAKAATNVSRQESPMASGLNLPTSKSEQATANAAPQKTGAAPSASVQTADAALAQNAISSATISDLPLNGRNVADLQQLQTADTKGAASQDSLARKKELPGLQIERDGGKDKTLAGLSGRITDRTGAVIAGATVTLRDATGKTRQTTTSADGSFHLAELPAGQYGLTAAATGFRTSKQSIELKPSELAMLQPVLDMGAASEQVMVEAGALSVQTESASVSGQVGAELPIGGRVIPLPSPVPVAATVSHGKRLLSLDSAGNLFLSRNEGKKWKKIKPQWAGKAVCIELTPAYMSEASPKPKNKTSGAASEGAVFLLTTDAGAVWTSKDGAHWHQQ
jgi:hypothetical protein